MGFREGWWVGNTGVGHRGASVCAGTLYALREGTGVTNPATDQLGPALTSTGCHAGLPGPLGAWESRAVSGRGWANPAGTRRYTNIYIEETSSKIGSGKGLLVS